MILLLLLLSLAVIPSDDPVTLRFAVIGGNRLGQKASASVPSTANLAQLRQSLDDLVALQPDLVFFTGDIVDNEAGDGGRSLHAQLEAWIQVVESHPLWGRTTVCCMPGNHEVLRFADNAEVPDPPCYTVWQDWLQSHRLAAPAQDWATGPQLTGPQASYSFTRNGVHFIAVNTDSLNQVDDPETHLPYAGWVPYQWIAQDLHKAQSDPEVKAIFMLGHKPLDVPQFGEEHTPIVNCAEWNLSDQLRADFLTCPKFRAYLTGHEHLWEARRLGGPGAPWQVIIGNGGAPPNSRWVKAGRGRFGFTMLQVHASGKVDMTEYARPIPDPYYGPTVPAQPREARQL